MLTIYGPEMIALKIPGGRILSRLNVICNLKVYKLYIYMLRNNVNVTASLSIQLEIDLIMKTDLVLKKYKEELDTYRPACA